MQSFANRKHGTQSSYKVVYLKKRKFKWSSSEASSLGFTFCTDNTHIFQANLEPKTVLF